MANPYRMEPKTAFFFWSGTITSHSFDEDLYPHEFKTAQVHSHLPEYFFLVSQPRDYQDFYGAIRYRGVGPYWPLYSLN